MQIIKYIIHLKSEKDKIEQYYFILQILLTDFVCLYDYEF